MKFLSEPGAILAREPSVSNTGRQSEQASPQVAHGWPEVDRTIGPLGPEKASHATQFGTLGGHRSGSGDRVAEESGAGGVAGSRADELHATATMKESATSTTPGAFRTGVREICRATEEGYRGQILCLPTTFATLFSLHVVRGTHPGDPRCAAQASDQHIFFVLMRAVFECLRWHR